MMTKKMFGHIVFYCWVITFVVYYVCGQRGLLKGYVYAREIKGIEHEISLLEREISQLEYEIDQWEREPFYKEKVAREQLQLARPGDMVYYISD
jgi:cell division protein FtsB